MMIESAEDWGAKKSNKYVLIVGEEPTRSAPTLTWSKALSREGVPCQFVSEADFLETRRWIKLLWGAQAVLFQWYVKVPPFFIHQLAWAPVFGVPVIRKWSGTDSYNCVQNAEIRLSAAKLGRIVSANFTERNLVDELASIGIAAQSFAPVLSLPESHQPLNKTFQPRAVLVYLPGDRKEFYGFSIVEAMIAEFPELDFIIVGDDTHSLSKWPNVKSKGWIEDMEPIWPEVGLLLRFTEHDGMPRMVLEALARCKYVVHNHPVPGCWLVNNEQQVSTALAKFSDVAAPNYEGEAAFSEILGIGNEPALADAIHRQRVTLSIFAGSLAVLATHRWSNIKSRLIQWMRWS